jgi:hypothetical protein
MKGRMARDLTCAGIRQRDDAQNLAQLVRRWLFIFMAGDGPA